MSVPGETPQDHIKIIETNIKEGISDQEIAATNHAINFLNNDKNKKTEIKEKVQEKIDKSKTTITKEINTIFQTDGKFDSNKINKLTEAQTQAYINIITWLNDPTLLDIKTALEKKQKEKEKQAEETRLNLILAQPVTPESTQRFFEKNSKEDFNKILNMIVKNQPTPVQIAGDIEDTKQKDIKLKATPAEGTLEYKLFERIKMYTKESDTTKIANVRISKANKETTPDAFTDQRFDKDERIIAYDVYVYTKDKENNENNENKTTKETYTWTKQTNKTAQKLVRGDKVNTQKTIGKQSKVEDFTSTDDNFAKTQFKGDADTTKTGLKAFDDRGNFTKFEEFIQTKDAAYMKKNMDTIIKAILTYTPTGIDKEDNETNTYVDLKNGYANVLNDYMSTCEDIDIIQTYLSYMTTSNLNLFGVDKPTRTANYNKVLFKDPKNNIMRPIIQQIIDSSNNIKKQELLTQIAGVKNAITEKTSMSIGETITKGFDGLLDAFGPMLFGILKMFGIGKTTLYKRFGPGAKDKIDAKFNEHYKVGREEAANAINTIAEDEDYKDDLKLDYGINIDKEGNILNKYPTKYPRGKDFKEKFNENIAQYIETLKTNSKYINVGILNACVQMYNKTKNTSININDIVTIETTKIDGKEVKTITGIKNQKNNIEGKESDMFTEVMTNYLKSDTPWDNIATANKNITIPYIEDKKTTSQNEQGLDIDSAQNYLITTKKQLVKYLTASLFSDKELEYIMTENGLETQQPKAPKLETKDIVYTTKIDKVNFRDGTDPNKATSLEENTDVTAVIDDTSKTEISVKGKDIKIEDAKLQNTDFVKVIYTNKEGTKQTGYIAKEYLQPKTA